MSSINEYLVQIQQLTNRNLELLNAINQAFLTKAEHLSVSIGNEQYTIPSFLALENKVNMLEDNLYNLINAPKTGEAAFDFGGNTQMIEIKGFSNVPAKALTDTTADQYIEFGVENNNLLKDFCTPRPYIHLELMSIPSSIQQVYIKKIVLNTNNSDILTTFTNLLGSNVSTPVEYSDVVKKLVSYISDVDYTEYNTLMNLPVRDTVGYGEYNILSIEKNWTDTDLEEHYVLKLDNLNYFIKDETIQKQLNVGDYLVTYDDKCKLEIEDIKVSTNTVTVKVCWSAYVNLVTKEDGNKELSTLKYLSNSNFDDSKYINVPLEENRYVIIFVAPVDRNSLIQSPWGTGVLFDVDKMYCNIGSNTYYFRDYYNKFVTNVGDTLTGLSDMLDETFVNYTENDFNVLTHAKPVIDSSKLSVVEINKHLSNSPTIQEIYGLYNQKQEQKSKLENIQKEIDAVNSLLADTSFQDTTNNRVVYEQQLASLYTQKKEITSNITSLLNEISIAATDTNTPIDNPKYHIRGFFDYESFMKNNSIATNIYKIEVQYRYKNASKATGTATTISGDDIFSDWNTMDSVYNQREAIYDGKIRFKTPDDTTNKNEISFNQIDIPISQGETVDMRLRVLYSVGQPFVNTYSQWSDITNVVFPEEYKQNVTVLNIIDENNSDIQKNQFTSLLDKDGITDHANDKIIDQDITYFHKPDNIASGFYTQERRIIPLSDKLAEMDSNITTLMDEILGTETEDVTVVIDDGVHETICHPFALNQHILLDFESATKNNHDSSIAEQTLTLTISNNSDHMVKLFSIFPGSYNEHISNGTTKYDKGDYYGSGGVNVYWFNSLFNNQSIQYQNQWLYFRIKDAYNGATLGDYGYNKDLGYSGVAGTGFLSNYNIKIIPINDNVNDICINGGTYSYVTLKSGGSVSIPIYVSYKSGEMTANFAFDIRTSLYKDPISYSVQLKTTKSKSTNTSLQKSIKTSKYNPVVVKASDVTKVSTVKNKFIKK